MTTQAALDRFNDLQKQGFTKDTHATTRIKVKRVFVACEQCRDWHYKGKHTKPKHERKAGKQRVVEMSINLGEK